MSLVLFLVSILLFICFFYVFSPFNSPFSFDDTLSSNQGRFELAIARTVLADKETVDCARRLVNGMLKVYSQISTESEDQQLVVDYISQMYRFRVPILFIIYDILFHEKERKKELTEISIRAFLERTIRV
jgi:hypothetical protein